MHGKAEAVKDIVRFLGDDESGMLITGTFQCKKHYLVMAVLEQNYKNARILFRINSMQNIAMREFTPLKKVPRAGELVRIGQNYYEFDAAFSKQTWSKTSQSFDACIVYPIDAICSKPDIEPIQDLHKYKQINKCFYCSWTDSPRNNYSLLESFYTCSTVYDAEEEDPSYHKRVLDAIRRQEQLYR